MPLLFPIEAEHEGMSLIPDSLARGRQSEEMEWLELDPQGEVDSQRHLSEHEVESLGLASGPGWVLALSVVPFLPQWS